MLFFRNITVFLVILGCMGIWTNNKNSLGMKLSLHVKSRKPSFFLIKKVFAQYAKHYINRSTSFIKPTRLIPWICTAIHSSAIKQPLNTDRKCIRSTVYQKRQYDNMHILAITPYVCRMVNIDYSTSVTWACTNVVM